MQNSKNSKPFPGIKANREIEIPIGTASAGGRIVAFDVLRCIAICGIVAVHVCYSFHDETFQHAGQQLGGTFNAVFLLLSAILLGRSKRLAGAPPRKFLSRRVLRIGTPLWVFLALFFAATATWTDVRIPMMKAAAEFAFLGWPIKLPGLGHLWFVTLILLCYGLVVFLERVPRLFDTAWKQAMSGMAAVITSLLFERHGIPAVQAPPYIFAFGVAWKHSREVLAVAEGCLSRAGATTITTLAFVALQTIGTIAFQAGLWNITQTGAYILGLIAGMAWILAAVVLLKRVHLPAGTAKIFSLVATVSFEIYLIHNPFTRTPFPLHKLFGLESFPVRYLAVLAVSLTLAVPLHAVSVYIRNSLSRDSGSR